MAKHEELLIEDIEESDCLFILAEYMKLLKVKILMRSRGGKKQE